MLNNNRLILLVGADANYVLLIQRAFQRAGSHGVLKVARDGEEAIAYLAGRGRYRDRARFPLPFLVLLDLELPRGDGFEVLHWLRSQPELKEILVVVLTASSLPAEVERIYDAGANSYLVKPFGFEETVNLVKRFEVYWNEINRAPAERAAERVRPEPSLV